MILKVAIFDYGAGNIFSLRNSLEKNGAQVDIITGLNKSKEYSGLLLPGVGNFDPAIRSIRDYSSTDFKDYVGESMPVLGTPFCFLSLKDAFRNATANDLIAASILW